MNNTHIWAKRILVILLALSLFGCSYNIELIQEEVQLYVGQEINPTDYLSEATRSNEKLEILNNINTSLAGDYEIVYKISSKEAVLRVVVLRYPINLISQDVLLETGSSFEPNNYLSEEDKSNDIKVVSNVDVNKAGDYIVVYSFDGIEKVLNVSVKDIEIILVQESVSIDLGSTFNPKMYLAGDFPDSPSISITNNVNTSKIGTYQVTYLAGTKSKTLSVTVKDVSPILTTTSTSIKQDSAFDPSVYLVAEDRNNTNIIITNNVDSKVPGTYLVTYQLGEITKNLNVTVTKVTTSTTQTPPASTSYSLKVLSLTSPVSAGENATIVVQGKAGKSYSITVYYKSGPSTAEGLHPKTADASGKVTWTWKVGTRTSSGSWKIVISGDGKNVSTNIVVR